MRFIHTSDWQLGMTRHFLEGEAQARYTAARIDAIRTIGEVARREGADAVVVAGDVFDSNLVAPATVQRSLDAMASVPVPLYLLAGNHDALSAVSIYTSETWQKHVPPNVHVLQPGINATVCGIEIVAAPLPSNDPRADLLGRQLDALSGPGPLPRIAVGHGVVDAIEPDRTNPSTMSLARMERALESGAVEYVALGDRHSRLSVGNTGLVQYSGASEVTSFVEEYPGDVLVVDLEPGRPAQVSSVHVGTWRFITLQAEVSLDADLDDLDRRLSGLDPKDRIVVRTALVGTLTLAQKARLDELLERHGRTFAAMFAWDRHQRISVMIDGSDVQSMRVSGFVEAAARELESTAGTHGDDVDEASEAAQDALSLLFRLTAGVRR